MRKPKGSKKSPGYPPGDTGDFRGVPGDFLVQTPRSLCPSTASPADQIRLLRPLQQWGKFKNRSLILYSYVKRPISRSEIGIDFMPLTWAIILLNHVTKHPNHVTKTPLSPSAYTSSRLSVLMRTGGKHTLQRPKTSQGRSWTEGLRPSRGTWEWVASP